MTSKEALEKLSYIPIYKEDEHNVITDIDSCCIYKGDLCEVYDTEVNAIKKDLEILEILKRMVIVRKGNTWYYLDTEHPFFDSQEDVDKVKEWLEND